MKKTFDCVEMKHQIQAEQLKRLKGLTNAEQIQLMRREILKDPILARIWKQSKRVRQQDTAA
jgi:hypothetical protein